MRSIARWPLALVLTTLLVPAAEAGSPRPGPTRSAAGRAIPRSFYNPFGNPFVEHGVRVWRDALRLPHVPVYPSRPSIAREAPIQIGVHASDPGLSIVRGKGSITIRGVAAGPKPARDIFGIESDFASYARGIGFDLDVATAPTVDVFGEEDFTEKNSRLFSVTTSGGETDVAIAEQLARKVNAVGRYRATVTALPRGGARIELERLRTSP